MNNKMLTPFKWCMLQSFPFIEATFDAIDNYSLLCKIIEYVNKNIEKTNQLGINVEELNNWFKTLDLQEEINNKLDEMASNGELQLIMQPYFEILNSELENFEKQINNQINNINVKVENIANGSPIAVNSISEMIDTNKIYVNTSDGYWYFYNGSNWERGSIYQSTGISDNSVSISNLDLNLQHDLYNIINADNVIWGSYGLANGAYISDTDAITSELFYITKNSIININTDYRARITIYDLNKNYISNTGSFKTIQNYVVPENCYVAISIWLDRGSGVPTDINDGNSINVQFKGYKIKPNNFLKTIIFKNENYDFDNNIKIQLSRLMSEKILIGKGTKIYLEDNNYFQLIVDTYNLNQNPINIGTQWIDNYIFTASQDCYITIRIRNKKNTDLNEKNLKNKIINLINFTYVHDTTYINNRFTNLDRAISILPSSFENGAFRYSNGETVEANNRTRTTDFISIKKGDRIFPLSNNVELKIYFYNKNDNSYISYSGVTWQTNYIAEADAYIKLCFRFADDRIMNYTDLPSIFIFRQNIPENYIKKEYSYSGSKIKLNNTVNCRYLKTLDSTGSTGSAQGIAIYNNKLFALYNLGGISVFNINELSGVPETSPFATGMLGSSGDTQHVNNACFGNKLNNTDEFPLLYTSAGQYKTDNEGYCAVDRIIISNNQIISENIQKIYIDWEDLELHGYKSFFKFPSFTTDGKYLYTATGLTIANTWDNPNNKYVITKFKLPDTSIPNYTLTHEDVLEQVLNEFNVIATQGGTCAGGYIIQLYGNIPQNEKPTKLNFYNSMNLQLENELDCSNMPLNGIEPEDIAEYKGKLFVRLADNKLYELEF